MRNGRSGDFCSVAGLLLEFYELIMNWKVILFLATGILSLFIYNLIYAPTVAAIAVNQVEDSNESYVINQVGIAPLKYFGLACIVMSLFSVRTTKSTNENEK